jgi:DNA-binding IclR family transcriptional regulator
MLQTNAKSLVPIQSLTVALRVFDAIGKFRHGASLSMLAAECKMSPSKLHRYLATLISKQYVLQNERTGHYSLGAGAINLGLTALHQVDLFSRVNDNLESIAEKTGCHTCMSIWTAAGPMLVRWAFSEDTIVVNTTPGQVLSLTRSASGQLFAAFLPASRTNPLLERELTAVGKTSDYGKKLSERIQSVVENKYSRSIGEAEPHLQSIAVPVFDWHDNWLVVVCCVFEIGASQSKIDSTLARLMDFSAQLSIRPEIDIPIG